MPLILSAASAALLLWIWGLYPLLMILRARRLRSPTFQAPGGVERRRVSVLLATREEPSAVRRRVHDLLQARYPSDLLEIIVAIDAAAAWDPHALAEFPAAVRHVAGDPPGGKAAALNAAARVATGDVLIFADTQQRFHPEAIGHLVESLEDHRFGAISGLYARAEEADSRAGLLALYWKMERVLRVAEGRLHSSIGVTGAIYGMRRALWKPLPAGLILDDVYVPMSLVLRGYRVALDTRAVAYDVRVPETGHEFRRKVRTLTGNLQLCAWLPDLLLPIRNPVWLEFVSHKVLRLATPYLLLVVLAGVLVRFLEIASAAQTIATAVGLFGVICLLYVPLPALRSLRAGVHLGVAMQVAIVVATVNGLRGRWDVWNR